MSFLALAPDILHRITAFLRPPAAFHVFDDEVAEESATVWEFSGEVSRVGGDAFDLKDIRNLSNVCRATRESLTGILGANVRVGVDEQLKLDVEPLRQLHLIPTCYILSSQGQLGLLNKIVPGQLTSLSLSLFPGVVLGNVARGFAQFDPYEDLFTRVAQLNVPRIRIVTNVVGFVPSAMALKNLTELVLDDQGFWDGGSANSYAALASSRHRYLRDIISQSTFKVLTYRRKAIKHRPNDYAFFDFGRILHRALTTLHSLEHLTIRHHNIPVNILSEVFAACPQLLTFTYYPPIPHQLPKPPSSLIALSTNCNLPPENDVMPPHIQELSVRRDGAILPGPPDIYVPRLPSTLVILHAHMSPQVAPESISALLASTPKLRDLELLVLPLPWFDDCECEVVSNAKGLMVTYQVAYERHLSPNTLELGWREDITIPVFVRLISALKLESLTINHDHYLSANPFPDFHHLGPTAAKNYTGIWWHQHKIFYNEQAKLVFAALPVLTELRWRVCTRRNEAWICWQRGSEGRLLLERWE